jgi:hypothetical protein
MELTDLGKRLEALSEQLQQEFGDPDSPATKSKIREEAGAGAHL